jgi:hypothetical protein
MLDLIVLAADRNAKFALTGLLSKHQRLETRQIAVEVDVHPMQDSGTYRRCHDFLRSQRAFAKYALVLFDRDGCGRNQPREALEREVEMRLAQNGWEGCSAAIVIDPELDVWVWSDSPHVDAILGWPQRGVHLRAWLAERGFLQPGHGKPERPKKALEDALLNSNKKRSSSLYFELATRVSFDRCADPAFLKLKSTLQSWFPPELHT